MNSDGLSYLDIASEALRGGIKNLVNGYWSPAYPALISVALRIFRPSPGLEFPLLHLVNFVIFIYVLLCFAFFLRTWLNWRHDVHAVGEMDAACLIAFGFCIFLWFTLEFVSVRVVTPDLLAAAPVFLAAGLCCRISRPASNWNHYAALGGILGFGYYAKAAMFPIGLMLLAILFVWPPTSTVSRRKLLLSALVLLIVVAPYAALVSRLAGRLSIGEAGRLNYAWFVSKLPPYAGWTGGDPAYGTPEHPPRTLLGKPRLLEFASPLSGTYPLWYDPSYWYAGARMRFDLAQQIAALVGNLIAEGEVVDGARAHSHRLFQMAGLFAGALVLRILAFHGQKHPDSDRSLHWLLVWPMIALFTYALVCPEYYRYLTAFLVLFWLAVYQPLSSRVSLAARRFVLGAVVLTLFVSSTLRFWALGVQAPRKLGRAGQPEYLQVAEALRAAGVNPGDEVASVGYSFDLYCVRVAGARIAAQLPDADEFWRLSAPDLTSVTEHLAALGVKAVVARNRPMNSPAAGWRDVVFPGSDTWSILPLAGVGSRGVPLNQKRSDGSSYPSLPDASSKGSSK